MLYKLLQSFNVDMVITAICMGNQCFISASVCLFLIKTSIPIRQLSVYLESFIGVRDIKKIVQEGAR